MHKTIEHTCSSNNSLCQNVHVNGDEIKRDRNLGEGLGCERLAVSFPLNGAVVWEVAEDGRKGANRLVFEEGDYNGIYTSLDARHTSKHNTMCVRSVLERPHNTACLDNSGLQSSPESFSSLFAIKKYVSGEPLEFETSAARYISERTIARSNKFQGLQTYDGRSPCTSLVLLCIYINECVCIHILSSCSGRPQDT